MTHIRFDGTQQYGLILGTLTHNTCDGTHFDGIAQLSPCAMSFNIVDLVRLDPTCIRQSGSDHGLLRLPVGYCKPTAASVMVDRGPADERQNVVTICQCVRKTFQDDDPAALATAVAISGRVEGFALTIRGERVRLCHRDRRVRGKDQVHAPRQCQAGLPRAQALTGKMNRYQRRGACGIQCKSRTMHAQRVG